MAQRGLVTSTPGLSVLAAGRHLGRDARTGIEDERTQLTRLNRRTEAGKWQKTFVTFDARQNAIRNYSESIRNMTRVYPQQSKFLRHLNGYFRTSVLRYTDSKPGRREEAAVQQAMRTFISSAEIDEMDDLKTGLDVIQPGLLQGTKEWLALRENRITASAFGNCLGFWGMRRLELWEEKVGIRESFAGNAATIWGTRQEAVAVEKYKEMTGNAVDHIGFKIYHPEDEYLSWLGASPDGLIRYKVEDGEEDTGDETLGILEVKCPHNKGRPEQGSPWSAVPHYYMPQAQGLLEIFDRKHLDFYVWTINGSSLFRIIRDREYWRLIFPIMAEFWWGHVIPAKIGLRRGNGVADIQVYRPIENPPALGKVIDMSRQLAANSRLILTEKKGHTPQF